MSYDEFEEKTDEVYNRFDSYRKELAKEYHIAYVLAGLSKFILIHITTFMELGGAHPETIKTMIKVITDYMKKAVENDRNK